MSDGDTRARIIGAAERLFAEGGEEATSLRAITREAGVNVAAVHYHFGGRDQLLRVVLDRLIGPLNARRLQLLNEAETRHRELVPADVLLRAFLRPDLEVLTELRAREVQLARFVGRAYTQPSPAVAGFMEAQFQQVSDRLFPLLEVALPEVDPAELRTRMRLVVAVVTVLFATAAPAGEASLLGTDDVDEQLDRLVAFLAPGLAAPGTLPARTRDTRRL